MQLIKLWESDLKKAYDLFMTFEEDENGFMNVAYGLSFEEFLVCVEKCKESSKGIGLPKGYVPDTKYILEDQGNYIGLFNFRHYLTEGLKNGAGHIGFGISKNYRQKGYATKGLGLLIEMVKDSIVEDEIYMAVHKENIGSLKAQLANGAYTHHEDDKEYYTRIKK